MLEKLAAIADFADQNDQHELANNTTQLMKNAQFFDAFKALFEPSDSELGPDDGFIRRLTRGWRRGKFDRRFGLALAIATEITELNKEIQKKIGPIKEFSDQINSFYSKIQAGGEDYSSHDFKSELNAIKDDVKKMQKLVGGKDLRKALDRRNKLKVQQRAAVDKIKMTPEHKEMILKILNKEESAGASGDIPGIAKSPVAVDAADLNKFLSKLTIPALKLDKSFTSKEGLAKALEFEKRYKENPIAVLEYFRDSNNKAVMDIASKDYAQAFRHMMAAAVAAESAENSGKTAPTPAQQQQAAVVPAAATPEKDKPVPGAQPVAAPALPKEEAPAMPGKIELNREPSAELASWLKALNLPSKPASYGFNSHRGRRGSDDFTGAVGINPKLLLEFFEANPDAFRAAYSVGVGKELYNFLGWARRCEKYEAIGLSEELKNQPKDIPPAAKPDVKPSAPEAAPVAKPDKETEELLKKVERDQAALRPAGKGKGKGKAKAPAVTLPEETVARPSESKADDNLSISATQSLERQISALARGQQLRKLAAPILDIYDINPEGRETYDEEKNYDQNELMLNMMGPGSDDYESPEAALDQSIPATKRKLRQIELKLLNPLSKDEVAELEEERRNLSNYLEVLEEG